MNDINYSTLISELIKYLVTHPEEIKVDVTIGEDEKITATVNVHPDDLGRVIGKKGRVASSIRTIVHAAASRNKAIVDVVFNTETI